MRLYAELCFDNRDIANEAADELRAVGLDVVMSEEAFDDYGPSAFAEVYGEVVGDHSDKAKRLAAMGAFMDRIQKLVDPFKGLCDAAGDADEHTPFADLTETTVN